MTTSPLPCLSGETLGEGGGVGVIVCCCFSAMESSIVISSERRVGTCCFMRRLSSSLRWEVMKSEVGQASSSDMVMTKVRPSVEVSCLWSSCGLEGGGIGKGALPAQSADNRVFSSPSVRRSFVLRDTLIRSPLGPVKVS